MDQEESLNPKKMSTDEVTLLELDAGWLPRIAEEWGQKAARHLHFEDGFTLAASCEGQAVGLVSSYWRWLPAPLEETKELYIDILEVRPPYRRRGIARRLIAETVRRAMEGGVYQVRSWSSSDKLEALPMWRRLSFGLVPATTYPRGQPVEGFFVTRVLGDARGAGGEE